LRCVKTILKNSKWRAFNRSPIDNATKILTKRKQIKVKLSPGRTCLSKSIFRNKWEFTYSIQWELNEKALADASKTDGIFPLITNTALEAREVLRKYKSQPSLEKRMYTKKTVLEVAPVFLKKEKRIEAMLFLYFVALTSIAYGAKDPYEYGKGRN